MCTFNVTGGECPQEELDAYVERAKARYGSEPDAMDVKLYGDEVELAYHYFHGKFERIRRITGYLVGTIDRWNNGKRAEERDRVKHSVAL